MTRHPVLLFLILVPAVTLLIGACSHGPRPVLKDPSQGEFHTVKEMLAMSQSDVDRYCSRTQAILDDLKAETESLRGKLDSLTTEGNRIRQETVDVSGRTRELSLELRSLRLRQKVITSYVVRKDDTLRSIASTVYGDPLRWREIYEANKGLLGSEDSPLREGSRLRIPNQD